jgi:hypothetical protein
MYNLCYNWFTYYYSNCKFCLVTIMLVSVIKYIGSITILFLTEKNHVIAFVFASIVLTRIFLMINKFSVQSLGYVFSRPIFECHYCTPPPHPTAVIASCHPLGAPPSCSLFVLACCCIASPHPLVVQPSCPLVAPAIKVR